jgi:hypothetical protein
MIVVTENILSESYAQEIHKVEIVETINTSSIGAFSKS